MNKNTILTSRRGVALLQVLIVTALLAGMSAMILRASLSRTVTARQTRHQVISQMVIEACMAEVSNIWAAKTSEAYARDLASCQMCPSSSGDCPSAKTHTCSVNVSGTTYTVNATFAAGGPDSSGLCRLNYSIVDGVNL